MDTRTDGHTLMDKPRTNATATFMHPAGPPPHPGTVLGAPPSPGTPGCPHPAWGHRSWGGGDTQAQPWGHGKGDAGALCGPSPAAPPVLPPRLLSLPTARPHPQLSRATGWGHSASIWGLPDSLGEPPVLRGGPAPMPQRRAPPPTHEGWGAACCAPLAGPEQHDPHGTGPQYCKERGGDGPYSTGGGAGGGRGEPHAGQAQPRGHHRVQGPRSYLPFMKPSRTRSLRSDSQ